MTAANDSIMVLVSERAKRRCILLFSLRSKYYQLDDNYWLVLASVYSPFLRAFQIMSSHSQSVSRRRLVPVLVPACQGERRQPTHPPACFPDAPLQEHLQAILPASL